MSQFAQAPLNAELKFLADLSTPLVYVPSKGGGDQTEHLGNYRTHEVEILNAREQLSATDLDREGFTLLSHDSAVSDFYDDAALRSIYHPELIELVKRATGARRVEVFDNTRRSSSSAKQREHGARDPANIVHNDYTHDSGPRRLEDFFSDSPDEGPRLKQRRFAIINAWRPIGEPVVDHPLVLCDARSVRADDLVAVERRGEDRIGELQVAMYQPEQRWYYYPRMHRGEVLLFKTYDSALDGRARFTPHSSCKDPRAPADAPPRESLETRCLVFYQAAPGFSDQREAGVCDRLCFGLGRFWLKTRKKLLESVTERLIALYERRAPGLISDRRRFEAAPGAARQAAAAGRRRESSAARPARLARRDRAARAAR